MAFSMNHIVDTNTVPPTSNPYLIFIYFLWCSYSPSIYKVLIAKNVPAEIDKNIA